MFTARRLEGSDLRVAKGPNGHAALLLPGAGTRRAPVATRFLRADFGARCSITEGATTQVEVATVVECLSDDPAITKHFLTSVGAVLEAVAADTESVARALESLIEVFRAMIQPPARSVQGLWGELFLLAASSSSTDLLRTWHVSPRDRHDFASDNQRVEVKTTGTRARRHRFSAEQLELPSEQSLVIASLQCESSAAGVTIGDLVDEIAQRIGGDLELRLRLLRTVADVLGDSWPEAEERRYDPATARASLRFYRAESIPAAPSSPSPAVSDIRFTVDFSGLGPALSSDLGRDGGLFAAMLPATGPPTA